MMHQSYEKRDVAFTITITLPKCSTPIHTHTCTGPTPAPAWIGREVDANLAAVACNFSAEFQVA